jgi:hypothetical protein
MAMKSNDQLTSDLIQPPQNHYKIPKKELVYKPIATIRTLSQ